MGRDYKGRGHGGRGRGRGKSSGRRDTNTKPAEMKFLPHTTGANKLIATYETVKTHIEQYVQKTYKHGQDIAESLRELKKKDLSGAMPVRQMSMYVEASDERLRKIEQEGYDVLYTAEVQNYMDRKNTLETNLGRAYALILSTYCNGTMQHRIEEHPEFDSKIQNDPIELLKAIKIVMHDPIRAKYPYASLTEALMRTLNIKQLEQESLIDYIKRFKQSRDVLKSHIGGDILNKFVENLPEYRHSTMSGQQEIKSEAFGRWMAYMMIRNSDQAKYGSLLNGMVSQFSMNNNQYPVDIRQATDILSNHKHDSHKTRRDRARPKDDKDETTKTNEASFAQSENTKMCYCCGKTGHMSPKCPEKDKIPREDWAIRKAALHMQAEKTKDDEETSQSDKSPKKTGWSGMQVCLMDKKKDISSKMKDDIILDNGSTLSIFANPELVEGIRKSKSTLEMATNAGTRLTNQEANVPGFGTIWYDEGAIANIFSFAELVDKHRITFDSSMENAFLVHQPDKIVKFECTPEGLYTYRVDKDYKKSLKEKGKSHLVTTLSENREGYTDRQYDRAKTARKLYHIVGTPTVENFKALLRMNAIHNCPVKVEDVKIAERIFGPDMSSLKGKSTRRKPKPVRKDLVEIPIEITEKHHDIELCMDTMFVNECGMLTAINRSIRFRSVVPIDTKTQSDYYKALDVIFRQYNKGGFVIKTIYCNGEYRAMMNKVSDDLDVVMNYTNASDHVPEAERNNRTIKERIRATFQRLPYKAIPRIMIRYLAMVSGMQLNFFPAKGGVSTYYSPRMIMDQTNLDYTKHCTTPFGAYVQAYHESNPHNTSVSRTRDGIYLRPNNNFQGGHEVMDLNTGRVITCRKVTEIPVTDVVIRAVEAMAHNQGFKNLKFKNRHGVIFHDADWLAGVDYEDEDEDEREENADEDEEYEDSEEQDIELEEAENIDPGEIDDIIDDEANPNKHQDAGVHQEDDGDHQESEENIGIKELSGEEPGVPSEDSETSEPLDPPDNESDAGDVESGPSNLDAEQEEELMISEPRRSTRRSSPVMRLEPSMKGKSYLQESTQERGLNGSDIREIEYCHNLIAQVHPNPNEDVEYKNTHAMLIARCMDDINNRVTTRGASFAQQFLLHKGLRVFGEHGHEAATKEMDQLHRRNCFTPISVKDMTSTERRKAMGALMFLTEKRDKSVKGRMVYNGKPTREWLTREDSASPTAALESIMLTAVIDAHEGRDVMCADIPNAFIQAEMPDISDGEERVTMKITGVLVDMLVQLSPEIYGPYVVFEKQRKVIYVQVLKAIYGMLQAALLWYNKFRQELEKEGFEFNPYDPCVGNRTKNGSQHTIRFHVDDVMSSHINPKVNDDFDKWLQAKYGEHGKVKAHRGKVHDYLGMIFEYEDKGKVKVDMSSYVKNMLEDFPVKLKKSQTAATPAGEGLYNLGQGRKLNKEDAEAFHTMVAKGLFVCKRARPDIQPTIALLCTRTKEPNVSDWNKLIRMMKYLNGTQDMKLTLSAENLRSIKWYVDASFAVHPDFRSQTGGTMTFGKGAVQSLSKKQKLNTRSSTEAELVGADDVATQILWTKHFMEAQGYTIEDNILHQDNKSTILLQENGRKSAGKRSRALNVRYFFLTDQVEKGNLRITYCPTDDMTADYMTKPLQGEKFRKFRAEIMGL